VDRSLSKRLAEAIDRSGAYEVRAGKPGRIPSSGKPGISQLAEDMGVDKSVLSGWLGGRRGAERLQQSIDLLYALSLRFGVPFAWLAAGDVRAAGVGIGSPAGVDALRAEVEAMRAEIKAVREAPPVVDAPIPESESRRSQRPR
jgi:transcriptional regulator with XRE-family HTH domain